MGDLRRTAEAKLAEKRKLNPRQGEADPQRLQHELEVHQIELEMQNQELRLAQVESAAALERYTDLFDFAPLGYFNLGPDGTIELVNLTGAKFTGIERGQLIGRRLGLFLVHADRIVLSNCLDQVFATEIKQVCELVLAGPGDSPVIVRLEATVIPDRSSCRAVMVDITGQKRAEKAQLASARFTDDVLNSLTDHVVVLDEKGVILAFNKAWRSFMSDNGASTDYLGKSYLTACRQTVMRCHDAGVAQVDAGIREIVDGKQEDFILEYPGDSATARRWFRLRVSPLGGEQQGVVISHQDISESRQAVEVAQSSLVALQASKRQFKALFDQAAVGVALADFSTGKFIQTNRRYCEITGYNEAELAGLTFADIAHHEDHESDHVMEEQVRKGTLREYTREKRYLRKDRSEIWVTLDISAMWAPEDEPDFFIAVVQDITPRKLLEEQVRQAQKMEAIGTLAGGIAHDFNNILAAINGYIEISLLTLKGNAAVRVHLGSVMQATARATALVRQILSFSRQQETARHPILLGPIVAECTAMLRATIPVTIAFETSLAPNAPMVLADPVQVHQILMNLGTNAWHSMKDRQGRLRITLERVVVDEAHASRQAKLHPGVYAVLSVSDTGCGMDQTTVRRIFEPFFTTKPVGQGTGLGLAVVHGIMDNHQGTITVESTPGQGSVFRLYFPERSSKTKTPVLIVESIPRGRGEKILVVDDEDLIVNMTRLALTSLGYKVVTTTKPAEALAMVLADPGRFAVVLTDQTMPGMTGLALASQIHEINAGLPVILTTGYVGTLTRDECETAGIRQFLAKPASLQAMATAIHSALAPSA